VDETCGLKFVQIAEITELKNLDTLANSSMKIVVSPYFIYLFIYNLFYNTANSTEYIA
jgi:hypothetical protein